MTIDGAVISEQGVTFAVAIVKPHVLNNRNQADTLVRGLSIEIFDGLPVVLMAQDGRGTPSYYGRQDLSRFMAEVPLESVPWQRYTISQN
jgi:hypothetical protein